MSHSGRLQKKGYVRLDHSTKKLIGDYMSADLRMSKVDKFHDTWEDEKKKTYLMPKKQPSAKNYSYIIQELSI
jgi:L-asparaginase II